MKRIEIRKTIGNTEEVFMASVWEEVDGGLAGYWVVNRMPGLYCDGAIRFSGDDIIKFVEGEHPTSGEDMESIKVMLMEMGYYPKQ